MSLNSKLLLILLLISVPAFGQEATPSKCTDNRCEQTFDFLYVQPNGEGGVGKVSLVVEKGPTSPVIGFYEEIYGGLGDQWRASAWVAATFAALNGYDLTRRITYSVDRWIDGPSASAALTVALIATLERTPLLPKVVLTGTINPDGTIGPVDGVATKVKAAAIYGKDVVLIPKRMLDDNIKEFQREENNRRKRQSRDPIEFRVIEVRNLAQAYREYTGRELKGRTAVVDIEAASSLPSSLTSALDVVIRNRVKDGDLLWKEWNSELKEPGQRSKDIINLALSGSELLEQSKKILKQQQGPAYESLISSIELLFAAISASHNERNDGRRIPFSAIDEAQDDPDRIISKIKSTTPASPTELSMFSEMTGMIGLLRQNINLAEELREKFVNAKMAGEDGATLKEKLLAASRGEARRIALTLRIRDYWQLWDSIAPTISLGSVSENSVSRLRKLFIIATEANIGYFESLYGCNQKQDLCGAINTPVGYREIREMLKILRPSLEITLDSGLNRLTLGQALEAYLWSSILTHGTYRKIITTTTNTAAASELDLTELGSLLDNAKLEAVGAVLDVESAETPAILPRLYIQMASFLRERSEFPAKLQALVFFWRASAHSRLMRATSNAAR